MRPFVVGLAMLVLAGCQKPDPRLSVPVDQLTPVDALELHASFFEVGPSKQAFPLLNERNRGYYFFPNGDVYYVALGTVAGSTLAHETYVVSPVESNRVCVSAVDGWSGSCMEIFEGPVPNTLVVIGEYGNGNEFRFVSQDYFEAPQPSNAGA